ncbi:hypothetical protein OEB99_15570 [Actinotalea sp. M2MS4P-6]|uniref:hypothetical protein n=1 Tax=Actinotalea sp. M2MS4P-6 TaxID=2983762 RepID=UPI0021E4D4DB|nr:hypothetical protein [Actinotalea sp. M2MS4P-6]MCV2395734.1 hypothetical protein [Actinotalea sp. M2MS4P-6]
MTTDVRRRPVLGFFAGLFLGLGVGLVLIVLGVVPATIAWLAAPPIAGMVLGVLLAYVAPVRGRKGDTSPEPT